MMPSNSTPRASASTSRPTWVDNNLSQTTIRNFRMSDTISPIEEIVGPKFDRDVDVRAWVGTDSNPLNDFYNGRPAVVVTPGKEQPAKLIFFTNLDYATRARIYARVFELNPANKMVTLSKDFATKDVFPPDHFLTPWDLLHQVEGALFTCRQMRDELLTFFWTIYRFHVTFSPFTLGPTFSGLSIKWLNLYADRVNHLAVEVDFTKLGFGAAQNAEMLSRVTGKIENALSTLVKAIGTRRGKHHMSDLHLMIRRYKGLRPPIHGASISTAFVPYCPEEVFKVFNCFSDLKDLVLEVRMTGFTYGYTKELQMKMWRVIPKNRPWLGPVWPDYVPPLPTPRYNHVSFQTSSSSSVHIGSAGADGPKTPTTSDKADPIASYATSARSNYSSSTKSTAFISQTGYAPSSSSGISQTGYDLSASSSNRSGQSSPVQTFIGVPGRSSRLDCSVGLGINTDIAPREIYRGSFDPRLVPRSTATRSKGHLADFDHLAGQPALHQPRKETSPPMAGGRDSLITALELPNAINALNEQDPAFLRAVEGLKLSSSPKIPSADADAGEDEDEHNNNADETGAASGTAHGGKNHNGSVKGKNKKGNGKGKKKGRKH